MRPQARPGAGDFLAAATVIMFADAAMSLDNVVAVAAIARGDFWLTALGVLLTIPILAYGSLILKEIFHSAPEILTFGAVVLGWTAGGMAVSDPLVSNWVRSNAPALIVFAPPLAAAFVWVAGQSVERESRDRPIQSASLNPDICASPAYGSVAASVNAQPPVGGGSDPQPR